MIYAQGYIPAWCILGVRSIWPDSNIATLNAPQETDPLKLNQLYVLNCSSTTHASFVYEYFTHCDAIRSPFSASYSLGVEFFFSRFTTPMEIHDVHF